MDTGEQIAGVNETPAQKKNPRKKRGNRRAKKLASAVSPASPATAIPENSVPAAKAEDLQNSAKPASEKPAAVFKRPRARRSRGDRNLTPPLGATPTVTVSPAAAGAPLPITAKTAPANSANENSAVSAATETPKNSPAAENKNLRPADGPKPANPPVANGGNGNNGDGAIAAKPSRRRRRRGRKNRGAQNPQNDSATPPVAPVTPVTSAVASGAATDSSGEKPAASQPPTGRKMLLNVIDREQARVAIIGKSSLEELYIEKAGGEFVHGNIFKGRVTNVQANLQAAFVDIGAGKNAFLHADDVIPPFGGYEDILRRRRKKAPSNPQHMKINDMLVEGQELIVQITREPLPTKGPSVTTYISLPGRYLVLMPASKTRGVSKKITEPKQRHELRNALEKLAPPKEMGFIIRTAGMGKGTEELQFDLDALTKLWQDIAERARAATAPQILYCENELTLRAIRDYCRNDIDELIIDRREEYARAVAFIKLVMPDFYQRTHLYDRSEPLFTAYQVESEIEQLFEKSVKLPSGGEILIEQTEAMVAIDVNTSKFVKAESTREMIKRINLEAADAIARQLRLRDMGGLVMIDFIDMEHAEDRRAVEDAMRAATKIDRARITLLPISPLGIMEMTRQRLRQSLQLAHYQNCPFCAGSGKWRKLESLGSELIRRLRIELGQKKDKDLLVKFSPATALAIANDLRSRLTALETEFARKITIAADQALSLDQFIIDSV